MSESIRYECNQQQLMRTSNDSQQLQQSPTPMDEPIGTVQILCTHDGVLLKQASAEHIADLNTSGALSVVEYSPSKRKYIEWHPNENILIADDTQDQGDWALVDTISRRTRTTSECRVFNTKPDSQTKSRCIRCNLEDLRSIEVKNRGQTIRLLKKDSGALHSEYFFQHGNADMFVRSMRQLHILDVSNTNRDEFVVLSIETQKLKKTFAELDIGEIKASSTAAESWLPNRLVGFLVNFPDYVPPPFHRPQPRSRPVVNEDYQVLSRDQSHEVTPETETPKDDDESSKEEVVVENKLPKREIIERGLPLSENQWLEFQTPDGRISDPTRIKEIIFRGGVDNRLRSEVWKYLLNYYHWDDTDVERSKRRKEKSMEYYSMKAQWLSMTPIQEHNFSGYRDRKCQIEKDVKRTDRTLEYFAGEDNPNLMVLQGILMTYVMYNFDLGYVQGMSDLLAPILAIQENEVDAFWCFVGFMDMVFNNFDIDQAGMKTQFNQLKRLLEFANRPLFQYMKTHDSDNMYFCFRWLLVWFKREFSTDDVLKLWECLWTRLPCPNYQLLISVAILDQQTDIIIGNQYEFNEILKHVNELSGEINLKATLELAEAIYKQIKNAETLTNDIRVIIGEHPTEPFGSQELPHDFEDGFDELVRELTPEEKEKQQAMLEEACEQSMFLQFL
ncbi:TBC1 domain family member 17 [Episyrphus balteatus]|uniref:TBC1 domain family member 17 n=1 Tax=Episyrphus balteatus TaxID=286459 RepID=UPI002486CC7C|nr:TBC1 domain family member 17 [Episyrphus balteatus]